MSIFLNGFKIELSAQTFKAYVQDLPNNQEVNSLRTKRIYPVVVLTAILRTVFKQLKYRKTVQKENWSDLKSNSGLNRTCQ